MQGRRRYNPNDDLAQPIRGKLYHLLSNVVYIGKARHKDNIYDGEHEAIVDDETFASVQAILKAQTPRRRNGASGHSQHLLTGLLFDATGDRLSPVFTVKDRKRYRYYISNRLETARRKDASGWRLPAEELERTVLQQRDRILQDEVRLSEWAGTMAPAVRVENVLARTEAVRSSLTTSSPAERVSLLSSLVRSICVKPGEMVFEINLRAIIDVADTTSTDGGGALEQQPSAIITVPMTLRRRGCESKLVLEGHSPSRKPNDGLVEAIEIAHVLLGMLTDSSDRTIADAANAVDIHVADVSRILPLAFLARRRSSTPYCAAGSRSS